jgi:hypothetical protein
MSRFSREARILIHQRDSRVSPLSKFREFRQSFRTRPNWSMENFIKPERNLAELPCSSYSEDSRHAGKSSGPHNLASLSTLQERTWEHYRGLSLTLFTLSARAEHGGIYGRIKAVLWPKIGRVGPTCQAGRPCNLARRPSFLLAWPLCIGYLEHHLF